MLTAEAYKVFRKYQKATGKVLQWLATAAGVNTNLSLNELRQAAEITKSRRVEIPTEILWAFELAIDARTDISKYFKQMTGFKDEKTLSHEHFTKTLKLIYKLLRGKQQSAGSKMTSASSKGQQPMKSQNRYDHLPKVSNEPEVEIFAAAEDNAAGLGEEPTTSVEEPLEPELSLKDDDLVKDFEFYYVMSNLDLTCKKIKDCWAQAAEGSMSTLFAAWLTTAAYNDTFWSFKNGPASRSLKITTHGQLWERWLAWHGTTFPAQHEGTALSLLSQGAIFLSGHGLVSPWKAFLGSLRTAPPLRPRLEKPTDYITVQAVPEDESRQVVAERAMLDLVLNSMHMGILSNDPKKKKSDTMLLNPDFLREMNPPISDLIEFILSEEKTCQTHAMFGLQLLVESYKSFAIPKPRTATPNCRIQILRFAQDVRSSLDHLRERQLLECIRDCKCERCLENPHPKALPELERHLAVATGEKCFDLYHQAPRIAGHQMLVTLSHATNHGVRLCSNGHYVATVLHMYNLLRQSAPMTEESAVLESLCDALLQTVFSGSRSERKFYSQPKKNVKRITPHDISLFHGLYSCEFNPICHNWANVWFGLDREKWSTDKQAERAQNELEAHRFAMALDRLENAVRSECEGAFPVAKVNWITVYLSCTEVLRNIARAKPLEPSCPGCDPGADETEWSDWGAFFAEGMFASADEYSDAEAGSSAFRFENQMFIGYAREVIRTTFEGRTTADFLWNI